ncbi:hypothetical protein EST38_g14438 [Candolleomyces aberdarensis]|uniref:Uncharacterized protein n=1 Tax=Candolleomyces aberdarensis TaxID=2316362 RepID=A0A4Q2CX99_9AGAR|nr:hypothetical protein EST38_g14438 [Candolleomyces aberdarensis]
MPQTSVLSIVDRQFGGAYPFADEKGKPDTESPPGCFISTTTPVAVSLSTENRVEAYLLQGETVIRREPNDKTLKLDVYFPPKNQDNGLEVGHLGNQSFSGFSYMAHYTKNGSKEANMKDESVIYRIQVEISAIACIVY